MSGIDIIVPCYNYGRFLRQCVESVLEKSHLELRVLVIDDASTDETPTVAAELAQRDPRVSLRRHIVNSGYIATINEGIEWAQSEYLLVLDADDFLLPGALDRVIAVLDANPEIGLVWGDAVGYQANKSLLVAARGSGIAGAYVLELSSFNSNTCVFELYPSFDRSGAHVCPETAWRISSRTATRGRSRNVGPLRALQ